MKILHLINTFSAGGAELHLLTLCQQLQRQGVRVVVAYLREQVKGSMSLRPAFEREGIRTINLHADSRYNWWYTIRLLRLLFTERPDILHTHLPRADFAGILGRRLFPSLLWVSSVHNISDKSWSGGWILPLFNFIWCRADAVIAISQAVKDWLVREKHVSPGKVTVIYYGIEASKFTGVDASVLKAPGERAIIGTIGRLEHRKGHDFLIQIMPAILEREPNVSLVIIGHDPWEYGKSLQRLISELGLTDQVQLGGFHEDIPAFLHSLNVFAFATRSEGFGQVVIEAMAAGKPVVVSKIPPLTEIVEHGKTGFLVDSTDPQAFAQAILWCLTHPDAAQQMGKQGQERVYSYFSAERMATETRSLYRKLMKRSRYEGTSAHRNEN
jgi:glycosyltransferase involved in cell wall biosynthesis